MNDEQGVFRAKDQGPSFIKFSLQNGRLSVGLDHSSKILHPDRLHWYTEFKNPWIKYGLGLIVLMLPRGAVEE